MAESKAFFVRPITWHDVSTGSTQKLRTTKALNLHIDINGVYGMQLLSPPYNPTINKNKGLR